MGRRHTKFKRMFSFLSEHQKSGQEFSLGDLAEATGYKMSSIRTYYGKRLKDLLVKEVEEGVYVAEGMEAFDEETFIDYLTQRSSPRDIARASPAQGGEEVAQQCVLDRASSSFRLGLEIYHRPESLDHLGASVSLLCQAWQLLFDAEMARIRGIETWLGERVGLAATLKRFFPNPHDPVRRNLEWMLALRGEYSALLLPQLKPYLSRLIQACVLNFRRRWEAVAREFLFQSGAGLMALGVDGELTEPEELAHLYGEEIATRVNRLIAELHSEEARLVSEAFCSRADLTLSLLSAKGEGAALLLAPQRTSQLASETIPGSHEV